MIVLVPSIFWVGAETARGRVGIRRTRGPSPGSGSGCYKLPPSSPETIADSEEENMRLLWPVDQEEVKGVVFSLESHSIARPDGIPNFFYQHLWVRIQDFRPITLCNSIYKIISRVMVARLQPILSCIIGEQQGVFVKNKVIHDQVALANEVVDLLSSRKEETLCLKLDYSEAYGRVSWTFLANSMLRLGFHGKWIQLIMKCVSSPMFSMLMNGVEGRAFKGRWGLAGRSSLVLPIHYGHGDYS
ncbi:reverse transcriptase-like protein [Nymphaea thermarum]|nr:reverse transcriptase-like protein [Nymphaea thermarum]